MHRPRQEAHSVCEVFPHEESSRRVLSKSPLEDSSRRVLSKSPHEESFRRVLSKSPLEESSRRVLSKIPLEESSRRVLSKSPLEESSRRVQSINLVLSPESQAFGEVFRCTFAKGYVVRRFAWYSKPWLQRPPWIATTCFQRPLFHARTVSYRSCTANSDHLPCVTSDRVYRAPSASFPCVERPAEVPQPSFLRDVYRKKFSSKPRSAKAEKRTHFTFFTCTFLIIVVIFLVPITSQQTESLRFV